MAKRPELSIIIIAKNEEHYLPRLLESIKGQDYRDYEIILADAKSTDCTRDIARKAGARVVEGGMPAVGRNSGARAARGRYLLFLDADSVLPEQFLSNVVNEFKERDLGVAGFKLYAIDNNLLDSVSLWFHNLFLAITSHFKAAGTSVAMARAELHRKAGGYDETLRVSEDTEYLYRLSRLGKFGLIHSGRVGFSMRRFSQFGRLKNNLKSLKLAMNFLFHKKPRQGIEYDLELKYKPPKQE